MFEKVVISFYIISMMYIIGLFIYKLHRLIQFVKDKDESNLTPSLELAAVTFTFFSLLFIADIVTIAYFVNMAYYFIGVLKDYYKFNPKHFTAVLALLIAWILITTFRFYLFFNLIVLLSVVYGYNSV